MGEVAGSIGVGAVGLGVEIYYAAGKNAGHEGVDGGDVEGVAVREGQVKCGQRGHDGGEDREGHCWLLRCGLSWLARYGGLEVPGRGTL